MKTPAAGCVLLMLMLCAVAEPVYAATWQICRLQLRITDVVKQPSAQLQAVVVKVSPVPLAAECPAPGTTLTFTPETPDYQAMLPRREWPRKGQSVHVNYRYLDGICKGDGNEHPCRIKHYPLVGR